MCGIAGLFGFNDSDLLKKMVSCIEHRGPNNKGFFEEKNISLGFRRLSIIDLSEKGNQPMFNEDKSLCSVFNGEIYNFQTLRAGLEKKGHSFYSNSDGETIVHLYEEYGENFVDGLSGMFAIALWDLKNKKLFLARDRMGKKPLYYFFDGQKFLFASEIKALFQFNEIKRTVNKRAIDFYLSMRCVPGNETFFEGIQKVLPGEMLIVSKKGIENKTYWKINLKEEI
ncbi:MAG: asparagine synthetase B, partial [Candidatus Diapherotrites archaeon]|nr:asparagine synthetase B [Candidatus Diapherotrites archaeon]